MAKRFTRALLALATLLALALTPFIALGERIPPHEDPRRVREELDALTLLRLYAGVLTALGELRIGDASETLRLLEQFPVPSDLLYAFRRANELLNALLKEMNETKLHLEQARELYREGLYADALVELNASAYHLAKANMTLTELEEALNELIRMLPTFTVSSQVPLIDEVADEIRDLAKAIEELLEEILEALRRLKEDVERSLEEELEKAGKLARTRIDVHVAPNVTWVGEPVNVYGVLTMVNGTPLGGRSVSIVMECSSWRSRPLTVVTDDTGFFNVTLQAPYVYLAEAMEVGVTIKASFTPHGADRGVLLPSSNTTTLRLLFNVTEAVIEGPAKAYPGLNVTITVKVTPWVNTPRSLRLLLDGVEVFKGDVSAEEANVTVTVPPSTTPGTHMVKALVEPLGRLSGAVGVWTLNVTYKHLDLYVKVDRLTLYYPLNRELVVEGRLEGVGGPLPYENVTVLVKGSALSAVTDDDGSFRLVIPTNPSLLSTTLSLGLTIIVNTTEPWYPSVVRYVEVKVVNLVPLLGGIAYVALFMALASRLIVMVRPRPEEEEGGAGEAHEEVPSLAGPVEPTLPSWPLGYEIREGPVLKAYRTVLSLVSKAVGEPRPSDTLREYMARVKSALKGPQARAFEVLTRLAELELYSGRSLSEAEVREAELALAIIMGGPGEVT